MHKLPDNELFPELLGVNGTNSWMKNDSSSRMQMFAGHISQALVVSGGEPKRTFTGTEKEFGKYTFSKKFPTNSTIIKIIEKYPRTIGVDNIKENPKTLVIYEDADCPMRTIGVMSLERYHSLHQHFGFKYKFKSDVINRINVGSNIPKDTIVADSPTIDELGNYCYGVNANILLSTMPGVIEDGIIISKDFINKIKSKGFESRVESWGKSFYPLNLYGDENNYKPFPDVGDRIRPDGLLYALRRYDDLLAPVEMTPEALRKPDYMYDRLVYAEPNAKVIDVVIQHNDNGKYPPTPIGIDAQTKKYYEASYRFHKNLLDFYYDIKAKRKDNLKITPELHRLIVESIAYTQNNSKIKLNKVHRRTPLDDWRVEVFYEYDTIPNVGFKLSGAHGNGSKLFKDIGFTM